MNRQISISTLPADAGSLNAPFNEDYVLLLVISADTVNSDQRDRIVLDVVGSRCQYALAFGHDCEAWHDAIDAACFEDGVPEGRFLMTTSHDDESIEDVIDFLWWNTFYEDFQAERLAIVQIGFDASVERRIAGRVAYHQERQGVPPNV